MAWQLIDFDALDEAELDHWQEVRRSNPALDSPFFHPAFSAAVHSVFGDVVVARHSSRQVWFPLQVRRRVARALLTPGSDFQGPIAGPGVEIDPVELVRDTGLRALRFAFVHGRGSDFEPFVDERLPSPLIDTTGGLPGYLGRVGKAGRHKMKRVTNKASRELGEVRLVWDADDPDLLDRLIGIKRAQYAATGAYDFFALPQNRSLVHRLATTRADGFEGILSAVYADGELLAAHFGLRDRDVLHWWFPVFSREHSHVSPGWLLLRELISAAPVNGLGRIDLGCGDEDYKMRSMTGEAVVCGGQVTSSAVQKELWRARNAALCRMKASPMWPRLRTAKNRAIKVVHEVGR